jgi:hypothetical protein
MHLRLIRIYGYTGTNGYLIANHKVICKTIELPWKSNKRSVSCIPEGKYTIRELYSTRFGRHLEICNVPGRDLILFHPANDAQKQLRGCIAPVSELIGPGMGINSRAATLRLLDLVTPVLEKGGIVTISVHS